MEKDKFQEVVLSYLIKLTEDMSVLKQDVTVLKQDVSGLKQDITVLKQDVSGLKNKLDLVYDHTVGLSETQAVNLGRITKIDKDTSSLAELYGKHEVDIRNIKSKIGLN